MRTLILGAAGMLGHKLFQAFSEQFDVFGTVRSSYESYSRFGIFDRDRLRGGVDAVNFDTVVNAIGETKPDVVINCIGIIKQLASANDPVLSLSINSLFPHRLGQLCQAARARLIHISTDCVFNGRKGMYTEDTPSDAEDLYGRTKFIGEVAYPNCLTLRTSIIGRELETTSGLVEWFLSNKGNTIRGYTNAIYSGFTTNALAHVIGDVIEKHPDLHGVYQVSSDPINKYQLLRMLQSAYGAHIDIEPYADFVIDRSLDSSRFRMEAGFKPPTWSEMINEMATDRTPYAKWRN